MFLSPDVRCIIYSFSDTIDKLKMIKLSKKEKESIFKRLGIFGLEIAKLDIDYIKLSSQFNMNSYVRMAKTI